MIAATIGAIGSVFFKAGLFFSHLKFLAEVVTLNIPAVAHHFWYVFVFNNVRPLLNWSPI
jgi:hypothetical protein